MIAVYIKELRAYFTSMIGYIYLSVFLLISGYIFSTGNLMSQNGDIKTYFASIFSIVIFLVPILTMRLFSEERKMRTLQLLFTMPVSITGIVIGKFLATLSVFCMGLAVTLLYPLILAWFGSVEGLVVLGNYFGMIILVSACIAIGLFISALTENQIIAAVLSYSALLALWLLDSAGQNIVKGIPGKFVTYLSLNTHYREFTYGIFNPAGLVFFLTLTALFLIFSIMVVDGRKAT
ncbi:MAG: ABC transporter permease [Clostridia bacterium]